MLGASEISRVEDLRAFVVDELAGLQGRIRTVETDLLATYYEGDNHVDEDTARNRAVDGLRWRMTTMTMPVMIEHHMVNSNRCAFTVSAIVDDHRRLMVVGAKGQWHKELLTAAAAQLRPGLPAIRMPNGREAISCSGSDRTRRWRAVPST